MEYPTTRPLDPVAERIARIIAETVHPIMIVLFGSRARGVAKEGSDYDFVVVEDKPFGKTRSRSKETGRILRLLKEIPFPVDILLYSTDEVEKWGKYQNHLLYDALNQGVILYEKA